VRAAGRQGSGPAGTSCTGGSRGLRRGRGSERDPGQDPEAVTGQRSGQQGTAQDGDTLPHPGQAVALALAVGPGTDAAAVVEDLDRQLPVPRSIRTRALAWGPACLSTLVRASCTR